VKIADFGLVPLLERMSHGEVLGTPAYMAPERALGSVPEPAIAHKSDVYAFGVLAYRVLSGALPYTGKDPVDVLIARAMLCGVSGLAFAIGVYLPLASMAPLYVGGCVRALVERGRGERPAGEHDAGILAASGLVAGEGLAGVFVAGLVAAGLAPKSMDPRLGGLLGDVVALALALGVCVFLLRGGRAGASPAAAPRAGATGRG